MTVRNALYAQSGGVTAVINASARGVIEAARQNPDRIGTLFAAHNGIVGVLREALIDTSSLSDDQVTSLSQRPGGVFGSCRYKLPPLDDDPEGIYPRLVDVFRAHDIGTLFYNGGGDSADTAHKLGLLSDQHQLGLQCIAVPKTVDNDLPMTDCSPGFGSVARYVATSLLEASLDVRSMCDTSTKVFVMEVMGRHAGWIAASAGLVALAADPSPLLILFPEVPFQPEAFHAEVDRLIEQHGYCCVVVSEGVRDDCGDFLADSGRTDAFGHQQLGGVAAVIAGMIVENGGHKCHWAVPDYLQRAARHLASATDLSHALAVGRHAVALAMDHHHQVMVTIERISDSPYQWKVGHAPLAEIANVEAGVPAAYIREDGFGITEQALTYLAPLIEGDASQVLRHGLPDIQTLPLQCVPRKLSDFKV